MSRKNVFDISNDAGPPSTETEPVSPAERARPLLRMDRPLRQGAALGAISQSLGHINEKVKRAELIEKSLAEGHAIVELDPVSIDDSIVPDRMQGSKEDNRMFVEAIREAGQQVPILVRPKPGVADRYEVAYGHRRLRAARELGRHVRAVVRNLTDDDLVVAQGQENSARTDLTFIERARFAARLEERSFKRETIMKALNVDKAALSRLIALAARLPADVVDAVGPAPSVGRVRWNELAGLLDAPGALHRAREVVASERFGRAVMDARFDVLFAGLRAPVARAEPESWTSPDGVRVARIVRGDRKLTLAFDHRVAPDFGEFVTDRLNDLYAQYRSQCGGAD